MVGLVVALSEGADLEGFRKGLRSAIAGGLSPEHVTWQIGTEYSLFNGAALREAPPVYLPREMAALIDLVICHRDRERYALLYSLVWRSLRGERALLDIHSDPLVHSLNRLAKAVRRDIHKMHAFLRFRRVGDGDDERFVSWFEPDHYILRAASDFFVKRYHCMRWSILTPDGSLHWDRSQLLIGPPGNQRDAPAEDKMEEAWTTYFRSTFNPARLNVDQMQKEMPRKYWRNMPETRAIPDMLQTADSRVRRMIRAEPQFAAKRNPEKALAGMLDGDVRSLEDLNKIITASEPFVKGGRRAVLGEGRTNPDLAFVGEQPGDQEDLRGRPFVGPAGELLDRALEEAGIKRNECYVTNAVKHFKYEQRGKRRIHQKPTIGEVKHYRWWLLKELDLVRPKLVVALGVTAVLALTGKNIPIVRSRGPSNFDKQPGFITFHPSYLLRLPDNAGRAEIYNNFLADLIQAKEQTTIA